FGRPLWLALEGGVTLLLDRLGDRGRVGLAREEQRHLRVDDLDLDLRPLDVDGVADDITLRLGEALGVLRPVALLERVGLDDLEPGGCRRAGRDLLELRLLAGDKLQEFPARVRVLGRREHRPGGAAAADATLAALAEWERRDVPVELVEARVGADRARVVD